MKNTLKKITLSILLTLCFVACDKRYDNNLIEMRKELERRIVTKDIENETQTTVKFVRALSYKEIAADQRTDSAEVYVAQIYLQSRWVYLNSSRVYNVDDTLNCYYNQNLKLLRVTH